MTNGNCAVGAANKAKIEALESSTTAVDAGIGNNSISRQSGLQDFDLKLEESDMGGPSGRPGLLEQQQQGTQPSRQHQLRLLVTRYKSSICR